MIVAHILGWIFLAPLAALFFVVSLYGIFGKGNSKEVTPDDIGAALASWAFAGFFTTIFCLVEGWL